TAFVGAVLALPFDRELPARQHDGLLASAIRLALPLLIPASRDFGCRLKRRQSASIFSCQRSKPVSGASQEAFQTKLQTVAYSPATAGSRPLKNPRLASESLDADTSRLRR